MIVAGDPGNLDGTTPGGGGGGGGGAPVDGGTSTGGGTSAGSGGTTGGGATGSPVDRLTDAYLAALASTPSLPTPANPTTIVAGSGGGTSVNGFLIIGALVVAGGVWYYFKHKGA